MAFDVSWIYQIVDKYSRPLKKINDVTRKARKSMDEASNSMQRMGSKMSNLNSIMGAAAGIAVISFPIKKAVEFEDKMIDVQKVLTFKTPDKFLKFREGIFKTATLLGKLPKNIADIAFEGGKLGILSKNMNRFVDLIAKTSVAFDMLEGPAAEAVGSIKTKLSLTIKETGKLMDAMNFLADNTATSGKKVIEVVSRTVGTMKSIKMPPQLIAGWAAFADQLETSPELAASGLNMMVTRMMKMPGMMKKLLKKPSDTIKNFLGKFAKMDEVKRSNAIFKKFGSEAGRFVLKAVNSMKLLDKTLGFVGKNSKFAGSMQIELEKKLAGTKIALGRIAAVADFAMISIGDALLPAIKEFTPAIVSMISRLGGFLKKHPFLVKIGVVFIAILATVSAIGVVLGIIISAIGTLISPVALIVLGIVALGAGLAWVYYNTTKVKIILLNLLLYAVKGFKLLWKVIKSVGESILYYMLNPIDLLIDSLKLIYGWWTKIFDITDKTSNVIPAQFVTPKFDKFKSIQDEIDRIDKMDGTEKFIESQISVQNALLKNEINGKIEVSASPGSEIKKIEMDHLSSGNLGLNMAS